MEKPNNLKDIKIMLLGDQAVGKSSLMMRYTTDTFSLNTMGTAGIDLKKKTVTIDSEEVKIMIYDTAGHDRFRQITKVHYKGSRGVMLVYDVSDKKSYESVSTWMDHIKENAEVGVEIILVGNKIDIENRQVSTEEGKNLGIKYGVPFVETSAMSGEGVEKAFLTLVTKIYETDKQANEPKTETPSVKVTKKTKTEKKSKCCN
jgi:Ras-related protein Rab-8A